MDVRSAASARRCSLGTVATSGRAALWRGTAPAPLAWDQVYAVTLEQADTTTLLRWTIPTEADDPE
ncbi:hypothetical protein OHV13_34455 [Kitasatospora purpeofusca]|uniref:hypothetical protein n=1 Tax=Kitasatospora purpeofusca TaxID=67352 RepID=UPI0032473FC1